MNKIIKNAQAADQIPQAQEVYIAELGATNLMEALKGSVTESVKILAGQLQGIGHNIRKCKAELRELTKKLQRWTKGKIRKGKKPTLSHSCGAKRLRWNPKSAFSYGTSYSTIFVADENTQGGVSAPSQQKPKRAPETAILS